jgi:signal transduction histidine kinase
VFASLEELREIAHGMYPAVLADHGLAVALESLAARSSVPVRLDAELTGRLAEPVEVAAYYVVSETLANVGKHAHATSADVRVAYTQGVLHVEVGDDGVGGADLDGGTGLLSLADRVEALGGALSVDSAVGVGTRLRAEIPCR